MNIEQHIRDSQDVLFAELTTHEREDMFLLAGFRERTNQEEAKWLEENSESAKFAKKFAEDTQNLIKKSFGIV